MINYIFKKEEHPFIWIDIINPKTEDFDILKDQFNISTSSIKDVIEIGHLPKIEEFENYHFLIIRAMAESIKDEKSSLTTVTNRISIFYNRGFVITSHRNKITFLEKLKTLEATDKRLQSSKHLVNTLVSEALKTFEMFAVEDISNRLDKYEEAVFLHKTKNIYLKKIYFLKRQIDLIRIILTFYKDIVDYFHMPEYKNIYTQDLKDSFSRSQVLFKNTSENTSQLLSIYFNLESNHTNEIMRLLTIISVFFMPLTFVTGLYGMNFDFMPGTKSPYGYLIVITIMLFISMLIYFLFKKKKWL